MSLKDELIKIYVKYNIKLKTRLIFYYNFSRMLCLINSFSLISYSAIFIFNNAVLTNFFSEEKELNCLQTV